MFILRAILFFLSQGALSQETVFLSMDDRGLDLLKKSSFSYQLKDQRQHMSLIQFPAASVTDLSRYFHHKTRHCGGFITEEDPFFDDWSGESVHMPFISYPKTMSQSEWMPLFLSQVSEESIRGTIEHLSQYPNRYYRSIHGEASQKWLLEEWNRLTSQRIDTKGRLIVHERWTQPSVELVIKGVSDEKIILGGHGDSISSYDVDYDDMIAPGADDNASGVAVLTEIIRIFGLYPDAKPLKTLVFYSYSAEEVGLLGSSEIAKKAKTNKEQIKAVLQFDMTNFQGTSHRDLVFITDYTHPQLTEFGKKILKTYLPDISWSEDRCGYACSDHASWNRAGFPSVFPFEARMQDANENIHTPQDTLQNSQNQAKHAFHFAQFGLAMAVELGFSSLF